MVDLTLPGKQGDGGTRSAVSINIESSLEKSWTIADAAVRGLDVSGRGYGLG